MRRDTVETYGSLFVVGFQFEFAGEMVPEHTHEIGDGHIMVVTGGSVLLGGPTFGEGKTVNRGELYNFTDGEQTHSITALEDGSAIFNMYKQTVPE